MPAPFLLPYHSISLEVYKPTNPAAGASFSQALIEGFYWRPVLCSFTLVTDANVANRYPYLRLTSLTSESWHAPATVPQTASLNWRWCFAKGGSIGATLTAAAPRIVVATGDCPHIQWADTFYLTILNIQATDQISDIFITFEKTPAPTGF